MKSPFSRSAYVVAAMLLLMASCTKEIYHSDSLHSQARSNTQSTAIAQAGQTLLSEDFESGSKAAYASGSVSLSSGSWTLNDALIGSTSSDLKDGSKSVRIRDTGSVTMNFDITGSSSELTITMKHGIYGSDDVSTWQLWISTNGGSSWQQTGNTITSSGALQTATFTINTTSSFRLSVHKVSGGSNRINIDDITIASGSGSSGSAPGDNDNMLLGNPSDATTSVSNADNYLMDETYYVESYNSTQGKPNWVSWHVQASDLGNTDRSDDFRANTSLPSGWYRVQASDYSGSGFDRGHYCPSGDRTSGTTANQATFLMTNMMPQAPHNNEVTWEGLEAYTRNLVTGSGDEVYVIAGSFGQGGTGSQGGTTNTVANGHVVVPAYTWKVVVVLPDGDNDLSRVTSSTRVISVIMPNVNSLDSDWKTYRTSLAAIQDATGYNLLSNVSASVKSALLNIVDSQ